MISNSVSGRIVVVDDDLPGLRLLSNLLSEDGYDVRGARDGFTALMMIAAESPDIVLLDIRMPDMNGFQVCEQLKSNPSTREIPVLFISARDEVGSILKSFEVGGVDFISKPYHKEEVLARVRTHLLNSQLRAALDARLKDLSFLADVSNTLVTKDTPFGALEVICQMVAVFLGARMAFVVLQGDGSAERKGLYGYDQIIGYISKDVEIILPDDLLRYSKEKNAGSSFVLNDFTEPSFSEPTQSYFRDHNIQSALIIPLSYCGTMHGVLMVAKETGCTTFEQNEIDLVKKIANDISIALENESLNEQARSAAVGAERNRLARELHDSVTQLIYSLTLLSSGWESMARQGTLDDPAEAFRRLGAVGQQALREMRLLIHQLRPSALEDGLVKALQQRLDAVELRANIDADMVVIGDLDGLSHKLEDELFQIAQEALNNSLRHAKANSIKVLIEENQGVINLCVEDDGIGFDPSIKSTGMGLKNMQERANAIGGVLSTHSDAQKGARITVSVDTRHRQQDK